MHIEFELVDSQWKIIDEYFGEYWNNKIGIGGYFYWDEVVDYVYEGLINENMLISKARVEEIVNLMLTKIENDGGFMD